MPQEPRASIVEVRDGVAKPVLESPMRCPAVRCRGSTGTPSCKSTWNDRNGHASVREHEEQQPVEFPHHIGTSRPRPGRSHRRLGGSAAAHSEPRRWKGGSTESYLTSWRNRTRNRRGAA